MQDPTFDSIGTSRLVVRRFEPRDAATLAAYRSDPEVARYQGWDAPYTRDEADRFIASLAAATPGEPGQWFQFAVEIAPGGELVGDCALRCGRQDPRQAQLGFSFARAYQGRGLAAEALEALLDYSFTRLALHRVFALTDARNAPAQRLLERTGFRQEGRMEQASWFRGAWATEILYAQLASEWGGRTGVV
jgi:RimJ/RimL family protein N-acetyltransferase